MALPWVACEQAHIWEHTREGQSDAGARVIGEAATVQRAATPREGEPALISANFSLPPPNHRNEVIQLNVRGNMKFDSNVDSSLTVANLGSVKWS